MEGKKLPAIIIAGLAGSGKSTLAKRIAKALGARYVCGGDVLKEIAKELGYRVTENWWETEDGMKFLEERKRNPAYDKKLDETLIQHAERGNCVLTSWALPWIYRGRAIRIWLHASQEERARRVAMRDGISVEEAREIVKKRDEENRELYRKLYGYVLGEDLGVFDLIINTENKSPEEVEKTALEFIKRKLNL